MKQHILARYTQCALVIFTSIVVSPVVGGLTLYFFVIGWFTNESENEKINKVIGDNFFHISPRMFFNFAMGNIILQFLMGAIFIHFLWGILLLLIFGFGFLHGIFSTKGRIGRVW